MKNRKNYLKRRAKLRRLVNEGSVFETSFVCDTCGAVLYDFPLYDAKGCLKCGKWADDVCGDPDCPVCAKRPAYATGVSFETDSRAIARHALFRKRSLQDNYFHKTNGAARRKTRRSHYDIADKNI